MDDQAVKAAIRSVKAVYPNAFAERCANGGCVIRQSLQRGIVIGYVSPGDHIAAWLDAARRISEGHNAKAQPESVRHGSAEARGDRAQAVMDALHAIDGGQYQTAKEPTPRDKGE